MTVLLGVAYLHEGHDWVAVPLFSDDRTAPDLDTEARWLDLKNLEQGSHGWLILRDAAPMLAITSDRRVHRWGQSRAWGPDIWTTMSLCISLIGW